MSDPYFTAEYADGYVLIEDGSDVSAYVEGANQLSDVCNGRPCAEHGQLVKFCLVTSTHVHAVDWTVVPETARPVRLKRYEFTPGVDDEPRRVAITFGYEYDDGDVLHREVIEVV